MSIRYLLIDHFRKFFIKLSEKNIKKLIPFFFYHKRLLKLFFKSMTRREFIKFFLYLFMDLGNECIDDTN